jgi:hypothetical protein
MKELQILPPLRNAAKNLINGLLFIKFIRQARPQV